VVKANASREGALFVRWEYSTRIPWQHIGPQQAIADVLRRSLSWACVKVRDGFDGVQHCRGASMPLPQHHYSSRVRECVFQQQLDDAT